MNTRYVRYVKMQNGQFRDNSGHNVISFTGAKNANSLDLKMSKDGTPFFVIFSYRVSQKCINFFIIRKVFWEFLGKTSWCITASEGLKVKLAKALKMNPLFHI